jgi:hypothetical protein
MTNNTAPSSLIKKSENHPTVSNSPRLGRKSTQPSMKNTFLLLSPHSSHLKNPNPPPPIITDDGEEYVVKEIMDSKLSRGKLKYLVKWEGYLNRVDWTWEPENSILPDNWAEFHEKHPSTPRQIDTCKMVFQPIPQPLTSSPSADIYCIV